MPKLVVMRGFPGSGKTTAAKKLIALDPQNWAIVNRDLLRLMLYGGLDYIEEYEPFVRRVRDRLIGYALHEGLNVISDDTNLWGEEVYFTEQFGDIATIELCDFTTTVTVEECEERDLDREHSVGAAVIREMAAKFWQRQIEQQG